MYSRFKALDQYNEDDLNQLKASKVAIIGLGATGSVMAESLARHGVEIIIIDRDYLESNDVYSSNLYTKEDCKKTLPKAKAAQEHLEKITDVTSYTKDFTESDESKVEEADIILDGTDNFKTRLIIDKIAKKQQKPWIYTAAISQKGYSLFIDEETCFNCFIDGKKKNVATCETDGIMREVSSIIALESGKKAIEYLTGKKVDQKLFLYPQRQKIAISRNENCKCDTGKLEERDVVTVCGQNKYQIQGDFSLSQNKNKIEKTIDLDTSNEYLVRGMYREKEIVFFKDGRAIIEAENSGHAKSIYTQLTGTQ